jgi:hypothetical protein
MNSRSPVKLIRHVASTIFCFLFVASAFANNPVPTVVGPPVPQAVVPGSGEFTLKVYGANFVSGAVVNWNRSSRSTTFVSARELKAQILASDVATATAGYITVTNPAPGGGVSSSSYGLVEVHAPTSTIVVKRPNVYFRGNGARVLDLADFNNDGILDFAAEHGNEILAMLGNGDGSFRFGSIATGYYCSSAAVASGDFNNDGNQDLVFGAVPDCGPPTKLRVNLGDGNGKFRFGSRVGQFETQAFQIVVGDFNRDGSLDLITRGSTQTDHLGVFLGEGDGTFKHLRDYLSVGYEIASADLNGDGILDLVLIGGSFEGSRVSVMLGNGDGTFQKPRTVISLSNQIGDCSFGSNFLLTDFNADGIPDVAFCESDYPADRGKIWIALGNGDGTFKKPTFITLHPSVGAFSFAAGDFNSDGKTDLMANYFVTINPLKSETDLFLGNGDGTFQPKKIINLPGQPYNAEEGIVPADFNSDGLLDFIFQQPGEVDVFIQE